MSAREAEHLSIGEVLAELSDEFPDITISKIRFLESQGLVNPERTPSGYRKFYAADLARLRWILYQQKEHFLPLKVIKERLDELPPGAEDRLFDTVEPVPTATEHREPTRAAVDAGGAPHPHRRRRPRRRARTSRAAARRAPAFAPTLPADDGDRRRCLGATRRRRPTTPAPSSRRPRGVDAAQVARARELRPAHAGARGRAASAGTTTTRSRSCASRPASSHAASRPATSACTARSPSAKRCCSARCCCRTCGSATPKRVPGCRTSSASWPRWVGSSAPRCCARPVRDTLAE